jgi:hypothetical protein
VLDLLPSPEEYIEIVVNLKQQLSVSINPNYTLNALYGVRIFANAFAKSEEAWEKFVATGGVPYLARVLCEGLQDDKNSDSWMHLMRNRCRAEIIRVVCRDASQIAKLPKLHVQERGGVSLVDLMKFAIQAIADAVLFRRPNVSLADCNSVLREQCCSLIVNAFTLISHLVTVAGPDFVLQITYDYPQIGELLAFSVSGCEIAEARTAMCKSLRSLCNTLTRQGYTRFAEWSADQLLEALSHGNHTSEYYTLITEILLDAEKSKCSLINEDRGSNIVSKIMELLHSSRGKDHNGSSKEHNSTECGGRIITSSSSSSSGGGVDCSRNEGGHEVGAVPEIEASGMTERVPQGEGDKEEPLDPLLITNERELNQALAVKNGELERAREVNRVLAAKQHKLDQLLATKEQEFNQALAAREHELKRAREENRVLTAKEHELNQALAAKDHELNQALSVKDGELKRAREVNQVLVAKQHKLDQLLTAKEHELNQALAAKDHELNQALVAKRELKQALAMKARREEELKEALAAKQDLSKQLSQRTQEHQQQVARLCHDDDAVVRARGDEGLALLLERVMQEQMKRRMEAREREMEAKMQRERGMERERERETRMQREREMEARMQREMETRLEVQRRQIAEQV